MDTAQAAICDLEAMETRHGAFTRLCALGVSKDLAAQTAGSAHGPWHIANSPALKYAFLSLTSTRLAFPVVRWPLTQSLRTAGCGPACPVVWQGRAGDRSSSCSAGSRRMCPVTQGASSKYLLSIECSHYGDGVLGLLARGLGIFFVSNFCPGGRPRASVLPGLLSISEGTDESPFPPGQGTPVGGLESPASSLNKLRGGNPWRRLLRWGLPSQRISTTQMTAAAAR